MVSHTPGRSPCKPQIKSLISQLEKICIRSCSIKFCSVYSQIFLKNKKNPRKNKTNDKVTFFPEICNKINLQNSKRTIDNRMVKNWFIFIKFHNFYCLKDRQTDRHMRNCENMFDNIHKKQSLIKKINEYLDILSNINQ